MTYYKLLLCTIATACLVLPSNAMQPLLVDSYRPGSDLSFIGDYLDPSFVGESMSLPLSIDLVQKAREAGIIKGSSPFDHSLKSTTGAYPETTVADASSEPISSEASQSEGDVNVTGPWSLDLEGKNPTHMDLALVQNRDAIMGYGIMTSGNATQRVTASASVEGSRLKLAVMPVDSLDIYKLDLSLDVHTAGTYTAYSARGDTWSGDITGTASWKAAAQAQNTAGVIG